MIYISLYNFKFDKFYPPGSSSTELKHLGCWILEQDNIPAISSLEHLGNNHLSENYWERPDPVMVSFLRNFKTFPFPAR